VNPLNSSLTTGLTSKRTGFVTDERCFWHDPGNYALMLKPGGFVEPYNRHIENPDPKRRFLNLARTSGLLDQLVAIPARSATPAELARVHTPEHLAHVQAVAQAGGGELGIGAPISGDGALIAAVSAGCALAAVDAVMTGAVQCAYALTRPPGHHAEPGRSMGFCVYANAALAAQRAIDAHGARRVAILDWDVHFGNGTYECFAERRDVLAISIHQQAGYLQVSGEANEIGRGAGMGYSLNIPLPPGCGDGAYREAFERLVLPALDAYRPDLVIVPCGYDAGRFDPLGRMLLDGITFRWMTRAVADIADRHAQGRLLLTHEGGYCPASGPFFGLAVLEELSGLSTEVVCPFSGQHAKVPGNVLAEHQKRLVADLAWQFEALRQKHWA
jgi:acetoin utilization deacetylase AcuC-like enzyme